MSVELLSRPTVASAVECYHCGNKCVSNSIQKEKKVFCCEGCKAVYTILEENNLCQYYQLDEHAGQSPDTPSDALLQLLDTPALQEQLFQYTDEKQAQLTLFIPKMHCASCVWLLENLYKLDDGVARSSVNFPKKEIFIVFHKEKTTLRNIVATLTRIGYEPLLSLASTKVSSDAATATSRTELYKIGIAGFCFGNIMMLSFPEYFGIHRFVGDAALQTTFQWLNLGLSLPVFFYAAADFFKTASVSWREKYLHIDTPIALAIFITFIRSVYEIVSASGAGYLDSMSGIVFFMLVGRYFQNKTYDALSFDRDYQSYFPLAVTVLRPDKEESILVTNLQKGDKIRIRHQELIPADALLYKGNAQIDYSFVTGEAAPIYKKEGDLLYAGGRQIGGLLEMEVVKPISQSYLTQLWNDEAFHKKQLSNRQPLIDSISRYFTYALFTVAFATAGYWLFIAHNPITALNAFTAVLIVACPCALLLSATFAYSNILRILGKNGFYAKNAIAIQELAETDTIVLDKTGTLTYSKQPIAWRGKELSFSDLVAIKTITSQSQHLLSRTITAYCEKIVGKNSFFIDEFQEIIGKGIQAKIEGRRIKIGSLEWLKWETGINETANTQRVGLVIDDIQYGCFDFFSIYRIGLVDVVAQLKGLGNELQVISGDNTAEKAQLDSILGCATSSFFNQQPMDKMRHIKDLQTKGKKVVMIGDGLNDAGALQQSNVGIAVADGSNYFSPASDIILAGEKFSQLPAFIALAKNGKKILLMSFGISILYNIVGLYFATTGTLHPVIAAILMPLSSISIVLFTTISSTIAAKFLKLSTTI